MKKIFLIALLLSTQNSFSGPVFSVLRAAWEASEEIMAQIHPDPCEKDDESSDDEDDNTFQMSHEDIRAVQVAALIKRIGKPVFDVHTRHGKIATLKTLKEQNFDKACLATFSYNEKRNINFFPHTGPIRQSGGESIRFRDGKIFLRNNASHIITKTRRSRHIPDLFIPYMYTLTCNDKPIDIGLFVFLRQEETSSSLSIDDIQVEHIQRAKEFTLITEEDFSAMEAVLRGASEIEADKPQIQEIINN